jgi:ADP-heptose:LPS heptosyltransferase
VLALFMAVALFRPGRRRRASEHLRAPQRILLVRPDNRVGEALLMTPLLTTLKGMELTPRVDLLLHAKAKRVLDGHPKADRVLGFDRRLLFLGPAAPGIRALRRERYDLVVDCGNWEAPSVTSAIISRLAGPRAAVVGPARWPVGALHDVAVEPLADVRSEVRQRLHFLSPIPGIKLGAALSFRPTAATAQVQSLLTALKGRPYAVVNPGGRLGYRCVPPEVFASGAAELSAQGLACVVTWGPVEEPLARNLQGQIPGAVLAPATTLDELAQLMRGAQLTLCNNTGPMHLSVAVGTLTVGLFLKMDPERWGHGPPHRMVDLTPCAASVPQMSEMVNRVLREQVTSVKGSGLNMTFRQINELGENR